jgi:diacylglycerol kinase family enzyme
VKGFLLINPRSGSGSVGASELVATAAKHGIETHVLQEGEDAAALAGDSAAEILGIAGGDGSLAAVAEVALERERAFVCIPFGTRNHFARDLELDRGDPTGALAAFAGEERRIDVGRAGDRLFLNNISLGVYASLVHRREHHRHRRDALARLRAILRTVRHPQPLELAVDGETLEARVVLVANNSYELRVFDLGARDSLTGGRLHLYSAAGVLPGAWDERSAESFTLSGPRTLRVAVDGEPRELRTPLRCRIEPRALRVLVPPHR